MTANVFLTRLAALTWRDGRGVCCGHHIERHESGGESFGACAVPWCECEGWVR